MKKLIVILLMLFSVPMFAQSLYVDGVKIATPPTISLAANGTYTVALPAGGAYFSAQIVWSGSNGTTTTVIPVKSNDGTNFNSLATPDTLTLSGAAGSGFIRVVTSPIHANYLRFNVAHGDATAGTIYIYLNVLKPSFVNYGH